MVFLPTILVVDQDIEFAELIRDGLRDRKYVAEAVHSARDALRYLERNPVDIVVAHVHLREVSGLELVARLRDRQSETLGIVVTSHGSMETAIEAIRAGAYDFISKPVTLAVLEVAVARAVAYQTLRREVQELRLTVSAALPIDAIIGDSPPIREVTSLVRRVAGSDATVLITGESGTGKELVARAIHDLSERRHLPFVAINCGAIPPSLLESELFGHVRGAFTGADRERIGLFEAADGGTLFLDEIAELPLSLQTKLLRVLQSGELRRVGDVERRHVHVRLIAATHRDLAALVAAGAFREDLFYRINVLRLDIPPLRERTADIPLLAEQFLAAIAARDGQPEKRFTPAAHAYLVAYPWPGNVRQ